MDTQKTLTVTLRYSLTEEAQKALVLSGQTVSSAQSCDVEIPLTEALDRKIAFISPVGTIGVTYANQYNTLHSIQGEQHWTHEPLRSDRILSSEEVLSIWRDEPVKVRAFRDARIAAETELQTQLCAIAESEPDRFDPIARLQLDGKERSLQVSADLPDSLQSRILAALARLQAHRTAKLEAARIQQEALEQQAAADREAWIRAHGSERLKKALDLGLIDKSIRVYEDERLRLEIPEASGWDGNKWQDQEILNPSLAALETLERFRKIDPEAALISQAPKRDFDEDDEDEDKNDERSWRPVVLVSLAWTSRTARVEVK